MYHIKSGYGFVHSVSEQAIKACRCMQAIRYVDLIKDGVCLASYTGTIPQPSTSQPRLLTRRL